MTYCIIILQCTGDAVVGIDEHANHVLILDELIQRLAQVNTRNRGRRTHLHVTNDLLPHLLHFC